MLGYLPQDFSYQRNMDSVSLYTRRDWQLTVLVFLMCFWLSDFLFVALFRDWCKGLCTSGAIGQCNLSFYEFVAVFAVTAIVIIVKKEIIRTVIKIVKEK